MDTSPSPTGTGPGSPFSYDVFVSYSHKDRDWVQSYLVPRLKAQGVSVLIDSEAFPVGEDSVVSMMKAAAGSRYVLAVLTQDWVDSRWTEFESRMASKLLPVLLRPCDIPSGIRNLNYADFTQEPQWETELGKLLRVLKTAAAPAPVAGEPVRRGLVALEDLMEEPEVRDALVASGIHLKRVCERIGTVGGYKKVHDLLHTLQLHVYDRVLQEAKRFPDDELAAENLREHETTLRSTISDLGRIVEQALVPAGELAWVGRDLDPALAALGTALETREPKSLQRTVSLLKRVLTTRPSEVNTRLNDVARDLPLADLTAEMAVVLERMRTLQLDQDKVEVFAGGMDAFTRLGQALAGLVADHDRWQVAEQELRLTEETWDGTADGVEESWTQARSTLQPMFASTETWAAPLRQQAERMDAAVAAKDLDRARLCFRSVRREASTRFHQVDVLLMDQCDELDKVADPLTSLLERIES